MIARRFCKLVLVAALALFCTGCVDLRPNRVTVSYERDVAEAENKTKSRTDTGKIGVAGTYEIH